MDGQGADGEVDQVFTDAIDVVEDENQTDGFWVGVFVYPAQVVADGNGRG